MVAHSGREILTALYFGVLRIDPTHPQDPDRDRFILSKGHSSIALYTVLALRGYFPVEELFTFDQIDSRLQGHPDMTKLPGIDMSTGSLGQGISPGLGMALGAQLLHKDFHTWVLIGDGESQEGQVWEAAFIAKQYGLGNLTVIMDGNGLQQFGWGRGSDLSASHLQPTCRMPSVPSAGRWNLSMATMLLRCWIASAKRAPPARVPCWL